MGALSPGAVFGSFEVLSLLGRGGMGEVYRARDRVLKRDVALKVIAEELTNDPETKARFLREAEVLAALNHPNIGMIYGFQESNGIHCLVLEFIEGETLDARIKRGSLPVNEWAEILRQIGEALEAAHSRAVIHRDLKPSNIRITPSGTVKVIDFGLAKVAGKNDMLSDMTTNRGTATGVIMGTLYYMSPEQLFGRGMDQRSDIFSLGVVLYEMATGSLPFSGSTQVEVMNQIINASPRSIALIRSDFPVDLQRIIETCLKKEPAERFNTVRQLLDTLKDPSKGVTEGRTRGEGVPHSLPKLLTRFVGRQHELLELERVLGTAPLVTLAGPGGSGKTRLAIALGEQVLETYPDGVWLVDLAPISNSDLVLRTVAAAVGVREESGRSLDELLHEYFDKKRLLLILDNCEHVIAACSALVGSLLSKFSGLRVLTTSREPLHVAGETVWRVPCLMLPAGTPTPAEAVLNEAVQLFVDRAKAATPAFEIDAENVRSILEICRVVEGIPLAIELAAARTRLMSPAQILERLSDRFRLLGGGTRAGVERQQTLRATLDWSYGLLSNEERTLFNHLSAFRGGWTLEAAEAVCAPSGSENQEVLDLLSALADKSLVTIEYQRTGQPRFRYLETIRDYARERLHASGEAPRILGNHAFFFSKLAEESRFMKKRKDFLERARADHDNFRGALEWTAVNDPKTGLRLATSLWGFWQAFSYLSEARGWLERMLEATRELDIPALRIPALNDSAEAATSQGDYAAAREFAASALSLARSHGDKPLLAVALAVNGRLAYFQDEYELARSQFEEAISIRREAGDGPGEALALSWLGEIKRAQSDYVSAIALLEQSLAIQRSCKDERGAAATLNRQGLIFGKQGQYPSAVSCYEEAVSLFREVGDKRAVAGVLGNLAEVSMLRKDFDFARRIMSETMEIQKDLGLRRDYAQSAAKLGMIAQYQGDSASARILLGESLTIARDLRSKVIAADSLTHLGRAAVDENDLTAARSYLIEGLLGFSELKSVDGVALALEGLAALAFGEGNPEKSIRLWAAADAIRSGSSHPMAPADRDACDAMLSKLRSAIEADLFAQNWRLGLNLTLQQAVEYALQSS